MMRCNPGPLASALVALLLGTSAVAAAGSVASGKPIAVDLSYDGQHLALIASSDRGQPQLELANANGSGLHRVGFAETCRVNGIRWAPNWDRLAVLTSCRTDSGSAMADSTIWLLNVGSRGASDPVKLAVVAGAARDIRWTGDGRWVAFLTSPKGTGSAIERVAISGGTPVIATPPELDVHEFRYSLYWNLLMFTATSPAEHASADVPALFVKHVGSDAAPTLVFDPNTAKGALHDLYVTQPRFGRGGRHILVFLGKHNKSAATGNLYLLPGPSPNASPINLTRGQFKPSWFTFEGAFSGGVCCSLATQRVDGKTQVVKFRIYGTFARQTGTLFTVPGSITDGRAQSSLSITTHTSWNDGRQRIAFLQQSHPGAAAAIHVGWIGTQPPPEVRLASAADQ
ncbi:MAG: hypothetical protein ACREPY_05865 [Rhodanobacteraceae bacterium]